MKGRVLFAILLTVATLLLLIRKTKAAAQNMPARTAAGVTSLRLKQADQEPGNWMSYGRTYNEQHFSPLKLINDQNVSHLKLAWYYDLDTSRGQEATPLVIDGVMYFTSAWSKVFAINAATGTLLWSYDPQVPGEWAINACCDVVNRGVAAWEGKIFFGTLDGRLIALDAATGKRIWEVLTIDPHSRYTVTGAPRIAAGKVIIATEAENSESVDTFPPTTRLRANWIGGFSRFRTILQNRLRLRNWRKQRRHGRGNGGSWAAAARCGMQSLMIPHWICSTSEPEMAQLGRKSIAAPAVGTIFSPAPSLP